jgi:HK97 gp10 family phage protein
MKVNFTAAGADGLMRNLNALPAAVNRRVQVAALRKGAEPIRSMAESLAPRSDTAPHLADHIIVQVPSGAKAETEGLFDTVAVFIGPAIRFFYGYFLEFGTAFHPAQPFMRPAFDSQSGRSLNIIRAELWAAIRKRMALGGSGSTAGRGL